MTSANTAKQRLQAEKGVFQGLQDKISMEVDPKEKSIGVEYVLLLQKAQRLEQELAATMITIDVEEVSREEAFRVGNNWSGFSESSFLNRAGQALLYASPAERAAMKDAFPDEWEQWDCECDENGRVV